MKSLKLQHNTHLLLHEVITKDIQNYSWVSDILLIFRKNVFLIAINNYQTRTASFTLRCALQLMNSKSTGSMPWIDMSWTVVSRGHFCSIPLTITAFNNPETAGGRKDTSKKTNKLHYGWITSSKWHQTVDSPQHWWLVRVHPSTLAYDRIKIQNFNRYYLQ